MKLNTLAVVSSLILAVAAVPVTAATMQSCSGITVSGTVRYSGARAWTVVEDATHHASGIRSVQPYKDRVRIWLEFTAATVGSVQVTPDEKYAAANIRVGASAGLSYVDVFFYKGGSSRPIAPSKLGYRGSNVWITGTFDQSCWFDAPPTEEPTDDPTEEPTDDPTDAPAPAPEGPSPDSSPTETFAPSAESTDG